MIVEHEEAKALVKHGQEAGFLTHDEVALALDELDLDIAEIEEFYTTLDELQIGRASCRERVLDHV